MASGCALSTRAAVGPLVDTHGQLGFEARLTAGFGLFTGDSGALISGSVGGGQGDGGNSMMSSGAELSVFSDVSHMEYSRVRAGLLFSHRDFFGSSDTTLQGAGLNAGFGHVLIHDQQSWRHSRSELVLFGEVQAELLGGDGPRGLFFFPVSLSYLEGSGL